MPVEGDRIDKAAADTKVDMLFQMSPVPVQPLAYPVAGCVYEYMVLLFEVDASLNELSPGLYTMLGVSNSK